MLSLYEINSEFLELYQRIEAGEGEITPELEAALALNETNLIQKATGYFDFMRHLKLTANQGKILISEMENKIKSIEKTYEKCESAILDAMQLTGRTELGDDFHRFKIRKSESVTVYDEVAVPEQYKITKVTQTVSKTLVKDAIKAGVEVTGARIDTNANLQLK
jgi:hypothetical protein